MIRIAKRDFSKKTAVELARIDRPVAVTNYGSVLGYWYPCADHEQVETERDAAQLASNRGASFLKAIAGEDGT